MGRDKIVIKSLYNVVQQQGRQPRRVRDSGNITEVAEKIKNQPVASVPSPSEDSSTGFWKEMNKSLRGLYKDYGPNRSNEAWKK